MFHSVIGSGNVASWGGAQPDYARIVAQGGSFTVEGKEYKADEVELKACMELPDGKQVFFPLTGIVSVHVEAKQVSVNSMAADISVHLHKACTIQKINSMSGNIVVGGSADGPVTIATASTMSGNISAGRHTTVSRSSRTADRGTVVSGSVVGSGIVIGGQSYGPARRQRGRARGATSSSSSSSSQRQVSLTPAQLADILGITTADLTSSIVNLF